MSKNNIKLNVMLILVTIFVTMFAVPAFCFWAKTAKGGIYWVNSDGTFYRDGWKLIDEDNDKVGYYYYFNDNGFILIDDITPDYYVVDATGRRIDFDGNPVAVKIEEIKWEEDSVGEYSEEILAQIAADQDTTVTEKGITSSGQSIISVDKDEMVGPKPSDGIVIAKNADGSASVLLGPNVKLKKKEETRYDTTMKTDMTLYIKGGSNYSKKVNGTIFTKGKWKDCMALKGTGANIVFENPKNNFNKLKGRIATHYFSYSDRTTECTLYIYDDETNEQLYSNSSFNYNGGASFECTFYQKTNRIRFELEVSGQYTSRVCYLRGCEYGFDKDVYEDEQYDKEVEAAHRRIYGTESEATYVEETEEVDDGMGEKAVEGEDPATRYARIHGLTNQLFSLEYDDEDDSVTAEMRASISEIKRRMAEESAKQDSVSGPAFDKKLQQMTEAVGPNGQTNVIKSKDIIKDE